MSSHGYNLRSRKREVDQVSGTLLAVPSAQVLPSPSHVAAVSTKELMYQTAESSVSQNYSCQSRTQKDNAPSVLKSTSHMSKRSSYFSPLQHVTNYDWFVSKVAGLLLNRHITLYKKHCFMILGNNVLQLYFSTRQQVQLYKQAKQGDLSIRNFQTFSRNRLNKNGSKASGSIQLFRSQIVRSGSI